MKHRADPGYTRWYLGFCFALASLVATFNWIVDPLQFYRSATLYPPVYSENQRYQKPGLAKHRDYAVVVLGDSHAENFSPRFIEGKLGLPALNLAISGSTAREQAMILRKALETGRVRRVVWTLGRMPFRKPPNALVESSSEFPLHFYDEGPATLPKYVLSIDTLGLSADALRGVGHPDLETLNMWHDQHEFSQQRMLQDWNRRAKLFTALRADPTRRYQRQSERIRENIARHLRAPIAEYPEVEFSLFFPPYSVVSYAIDDLMAPWMFEERLEYKSAVVEAVADLPNASVFDFQVVTEITHDLDNYKDLEHYRLAINERIIEAIADGRHRVDKNRYSETLDGFRRQVAHFKSATCGTGNSLSLLCPTQGSQIHLPKTRDDAGDPQRGSGLR